ncbi:hypothetical protein ACIRRA_39375 [Nocardia sp. NPDC101769]|uniref:hypothetical protein n=1 Tax=Nocardia sp. NPDC101769 TaxID=3364333 RepID=UPI0038171D5D
MRKIMIRTALIASTAAALIVGAASTASANADTQDGPVSLSVKGTGLDVREIVTTYASSGGEGQVQAYYIVVGPGGEPNRTNSEAIQNGATGAGVYRDSYGPTGTFLDGTKICAGWFDPTGKVHIPGYPCVTIHS